MFQDLVTAKHDAEDDKKEVQLTNTKLQGENKKLKEKIEEQKEALKANEKYY